MGVLGREERVELIDGEVVSMSPKILPHGVSLRMNTMPLTNLYGKTHVVSCQTPLTLADDCEPEPDFALLTPEHMRECAARGSQPSCPDLVLEISESSSDTTRTRKLDFTLER